MAKTAFTVSLSQSQIEALDYRASQSMAPPVRELADRPAERRALVLTMLIDDALEVDIKRARRMSAERLAAKLERLPAETRRQVEGLLAEADGGEAVDEGEG